MSVCLSIGGGGSGGGGFKQVVCGATQPASW